MTEAVKERLNDFITLWRNYADEEDDELVVGNNKLMDYIENGGFLTAPASTKYHGAEEGGLYVHSKQVFLRLAELTEENDLVWQRPESPFIIGFFHDFCKCDQYIKVPDDPEVILNAGGKALYQDKFHYEYNTKTMLKGHGSKSVMILSQFLPLTEEEMLCIRYHMGAYEKEEWTEFDMAISKYPNVLWTHMADMLASKVDDK